MLSTVLVTSPAVASKTYSFLVRALAPPTTIHHASKNSLFAEFTGMTFSVKESSEGAEEVTLALHLHDITNVEATELYHKTAKKIAVFSKKEIDTLNPFL